ncbi:MAG: DNA polymerase III subunit gamma/tau [Gammaproteobacteria bacterium]
MTREVLALKWRPRNFTEVVGQEHVLKPLVHALDTGRLHHAYLFSGTRGVGKTSLSRILAACLNCDKGITSQPCGQCVPCQSIASGSFSDLIEVDAASRTQISDTRELLETVGYAPMEGRMKVYLIDEVHMLSGHSFNALLKTLEEPPEHVCFLFATTEPEKIPPTIISRCLQFHLRALGTPAIHVQLEKILQAETISFDSDSLDLLSEAAGGSLRDALTLTEQAIAYGGGSLSSKEVAAMLGTLHKASAKRVLNALASSDGSAMIEEVDAWISLGADPGRILQQLQKFLYEVALKQAVPDSEAEPEVVEIAQSLNPEEVQLYYQIAMLSANDLTQSPDLWIGLKMCLLRMLAFAPAGHTPVPRAKAAPSISAGEVDSGSEGADSSPVNSDQPEAAFAADPLVKQLTALGGEVQVETVTRNAPPASSSE